MVGWGRSGCRRVADASSTAPVRERRSEKKRVGEFVVVEPHSGPNRGLRADHATVTNANATDEQLESPVRLTPEQMRTEANLAAHDDMVADMEQRTIGDFHAGRPVGEPSDVRSPKTEPRRVEAWHQSQ